MSQLGYQIGDDGIDTYGVNHNDFTINDELRYQTARIDRENQLINSYNNMGIKDNYPIYTTNFWGSTSDNNYGFGNMNIREAIDNHTGINQSPLPVLNLNQNPMQPNVPNSVENNLSIDGVNQSNVWSQQKMRNIENGLLMNGLDTMYGMNRAINGISFGGLDWLGSKLGYDTQMMEYLRLKDEQSRNLTQVVGQLAEYGGTALTGGGLAKLGYNQANILHNGYKIGKKYDQLIENPYQGSATDVVVKMKNHDGNPVILQRGEAIKGQNGEVIASGRALRRAVGSDSNYGLDKGIYKHNVSRADAQRIPRIIQRQPVETNDYGQNVYLAKSKNGPFRIVTSPKNGDNIIASIYYVDR